MPKNGFAVGLNPFELGLIWLYLAFGGFVFYHKKHHFASVKSGDYCVFELGLFRNFDVFQKSLPARRDFGLRWQSGAAIPLSPANRKALILKQPGPFVTRHPSLITLKMASFWLRFQNRLLRPMSLPTAKRCQKLAGDCSRFAGDIPGNFAQFHAPRRAASSSN